MPWLGGDAQGVDLHPLYIYEMMLLLADKKSFGELAAMLQPVVPGVVGQLGFVTGDPVIDELARQAAADLARGGKGVPDGW